MLCVVFILFVWLVRRLRPKLAVHEEFFGHIINLELE